MTDRPARLVRAATRVRAGLAAAALLVLAAPTLAAADGRGIPWRDDFERAQAEARARGVPLLVQFTGPWCFYCRRMEFETFSRPTVVAAARDRFVTVKVRSDDRDDLMQRFGVTGLPTTILLNPIGEVAARQDGFTDAGEFLGFLDAARPRLGPPVGLAGLCPVRLVRTGEPTPGRADLAATYDGRLYRFADADARAAFLKEPEAFLPGNGGRCVVRQTDRGEAVAGDPRRGVYYNGRLYLCSDEAARRRFAADPRRYADADLAEQGNCPHCRLADRPVRGLPQFAATHDGRRYLFPDESHRQAFRAEPEKYLR